MTNTRPGYLFAPHLLQLRNYRSERMSVAGADFLFEIAANTISERLSAINRHFDHAIDLFSRTEHMFQLLQEVTNVDNVETLCCLQKTNRDQPETDQIIQMQCGIKKLPLKDASKNLVTSVFGLHRSNDLPGLLFQIRQALAPDGLFMAALPGDRTLNELRECLIEAESRLTGNASTRVDPFGEVRQYGNLLQRAGFALPVTDSEIFTARYDSLNALVRDLRSMGATSALAAPKAPTPRRLFDLCEEIYFERYGDPDKRIRATFEIVQLSGWVPHESQQKPLRPGSAKKPLKDVL